MLQHTCTVHREQTQHINISWNCQEMVKAFSFILQLPVALGHLKCVCVRESVREADRGEGLSKPHTLICGIIIMTAYRRARVVK